MLTLLGFGSSARRGATGWTDRARVRAVIETCRPDRTIDGASPAGGADALFFEEATGYFDAAGAADILAQRCPVDTAIDGPWPGAGPARNVRMYRDHRPSLAAGFVSGKVGSDLTRGSAHMVRQCIRGLATVPPCPVVVYREDGIEPHRDLETALAQFRRLYAVTKDARLVAPGKALASLCECGDPSSEEVLAALRFAADGSRWAPWIEAVWETVRRC